MSNKKAPYAIAKKITLYFFDIVDKRKNTMKDLFGTDALTLLIGTLATINAPTRIWGDVANFVLARTNKGLFTFYENNLYSLAPHVSKKVLAKIVDYFARRGRLETLAELTTTYLHRSPSRVEILEVAKSHCEERGGWTDPKDKIWVQLFDLAHPDDIPAIEKLYETAQERQRISDNSIF